MNEITPQEAIAAGFRNATDQILGLSAVLVALIRALDETDTLKSGAVVSVLLEFKSEMSPDDLASEHGQMIERFLDLLGQPTVPKDRTH